MQEQIFEKAKRKDSIMIGNIELFALNPDEEIIKDRNKDIQQLEQDLTDLSESMEIIASLLHDQGEELDVAENNIQRYTSS